MRQFIGKTCRKCIEQANKLCGCHHVLIDFWPYFTTARSVHGWYVGTHVRTRLGYKFQRITGDWHSPGISRPFPEKTDNAGFSNNTVNIFPIQSSIQYEYPSNFLWRQREQEEPLISEIHLSAWTDDESRVEFQTGSSCLHIIFNTRPHTSGDLNNTHEPSHISFLQNGKKYCSSSVCDSRFFLSFHRPTVPTTSNLRTTKEPKDAWQNLSLNTVNLHAHIED